MMFYLSILVLFHFNLIENSQEDDSRIFLTLNKTRVWYKNLTNMVSPSNPYCKICCISTSKRILGKICGKHTMCIYNDQTVGPSCKGFLEIPFSEEEIDALVDVHNTLRNKVASGWETNGNPGPQPPASNMRVMQWDQELALIAGRWAAQCVFANDVCRDSNRYPVGQNIAKGSSALNSDLSFIVDWYNNVESFDRTGVARYHIKSSSAVSQYTQLVWAESYQMGCARVAIEEGRGLSVTYREHFICNYGPTGNIPGRPVYRMGEPCSSCPDGTGCSVEYRGLCGSERISEVAFEKRSFKGEVEPKQGMGGTRVDRYFSDMICMFSYLFVMIFI